MADGADGPGKVAKVWQRFRSWPVWLQVVLAFVLVGVVAAAFSSEPTETAVQDEQTTTTEPTTTTTEERTTSTPTTTTIPTTTTTTAPPAPIEVARYEGAADTQTDDFVVAGKWMIDAQVNGGAGLNVEIFNSDGAQIDFVSFEPGSHSSQFRQGCAPCYFDISTYGGSYTLVVTDLPG